jgi:hypothetical protein
MACVAYFVHVAGKTNPADLPSRAPFIVNAQGKRVLDLRAVVDPDLDQQSRDDDEVLNESFIHHHWKPQPHQDSAHAKGLVQQQRQQIHA